MEISFAGVNMCIFAGWFRLQAREGAGELYRPGGTHRRPRCRVRIGSGVDAYLLWVAGAAQGSQEGDSASHRQHFRIHRQSHRVGSVDVFCTLFYLI